MSASTLSVTANPSAAARRRTSAISGDFRQGIDIVNDSMVSPNVGNAGDDKAAGGIANKDLSHSIRGEAVLERSSKDAAPPKKSQLPNSNANLRSRNRKTAPLPKPPKRRWRTILSVLIKNLLLLLVLVGLLQMVRRLVVNSGEEGSLAGYSDMEGQVARVESSLKRTAKMLQVQIEVVDKKVDSLVGDLRKDFSKRIEDKSADIETRLRRLDERSEALEVALDELKSKDLLTKDDLKRLYDELVKRNGGGDVGRSELSLDEIRAVARELVEKEIEKHAGDGLGMVDWALASGGAEVQEHSEPLEKKKGGNWFSRQGAHIDAVKMLKPSFGEPGQCFPLMGSSGFVEIRLRTAIFPEAITLEHVAESVAYDRSSAPKDCRVSGWLQGPRGLETGLSTDTDKIQLLTEFTYDLEKSYAQTYEVLDSARSAVIDTIRLDFSSNHGSKTHTCIYRLRVHGHEVKNQVPMIGSDS